jgi:hypothetical protein
MGSHGIVSGYRRDADGRIEPVLLSPGNDAAEGWGLRLYRLTLYAFCAALEMDRALPGDDVRPLVHQAMDAFWCHPSLADARAWGAYLYDSDQAGTAVRPLARPFDLEEGEHSRTSTYPGALVSADLSENGPWLPTSSTTLTSEGPLVRTQLGPPGYRGISESEVSHRV